MALNREDISKVGYKAKIEWFKERAFQVSDGTITMEDYLKEKSTDFEATRHTPEELVSVLNDLSNKATKLEDKIAFLSISLRIPVDASKTPELAKNISEFDAISKGEYISYALYDRLLREVEFSEDQITLDKVINNSTGDPQSDSATVQGMMSDGYKQAPASTVPEDDYAERYANRWLNNIVSWNEHDYKIRQIINFSDNYLDINPDPAYVPWSMRRDVGEERVDAKSLSEVWKHFSTEYYKEVSDFVSGVKSLGDIKPDATIHDLTTRYIVYTNNFLNRCNEVFDIEWAVDLVCCFMQWGIRLDMKTLKGIRAMLQLLQTGLTFDFRDVINGIKDIINNIFRGLLTHELIGLIRQVIQDLVDPIKEWIHGPEDETWQKIFACTPIDELINTYIVQAIEHLEKLLYSLIQNWYKKIELQNIKNCLKLEVKTNQKWMGELAKLLDMIIAVTEKAAQCGIVDSPNNDEAQQVTANYNIGDTTKYQFPVESNPTIYNSFISVTPEEKSEDSAVAAKTVSTETGAVGSQKSAGKKMTLSDCLKKMPIQDISGVKNWLPLGLNSQGRT